MPPDKVVVSGTGVVKSFGATRALNGVDFVLGAGEIHALLGGNGAGKSTLIRILSGEIACDAGQLERDTAAIAVVHQELSIMQELSVAENIQLGFCRGSRVFPWRRSRAATRDVLALLGLDDGSVLPETLAADLPLHKLQLIEIGRALASGARVVLLDEPTAALTAEETQTLFGVLRKLRDQGISFIFVSHRMAEIRQLADRLTIIRAGVTAVNARPVGAIDDGEVLAEMFGEGAARTATRDRAEDKPLGRPVLDLSYRSGGRSFPVAAGEIIGLAGTPVGPQALINAVLGMDSRHSWDAYLVTGDQRRRIRSPRDGIRHGVGYVSGDRAGKGLFSDLSIYDNALIARQVVGKRRFRGPRDTAIVDAQAARLGFAGQDLGKQPRNLSGGTQQKLLIARWLDLPVRVLVLEEPTRGVDLRTKNDLYELVSELAGRGCAVLWWSTEFAELRQSCDRVLPFTVTGEPVEPLPMSSVSEERLLAMTGTT